MHRTIAAAAIVFAFAAFALHSASIGPFEEPLLLLVMGSVFLVVGRLFAPVHDADVKEEEEAAQGQFLAEREART
jgi:Trk-type K+ transport system membrane component